MSLHHLLFFLISVYPLFGVIDFEKKIWPILEERCVECHRAPYELNGKIKEPKAGLRLDGAAHLMHGGDGGVVVVADHPSQSSLYKRLLLPLDDSEHMPPKGNPLSHQQKELIRKWIAQGLDFGKWVGQTDGVEELAEKKRNENTVFVPEFINFYSKLSEGLVPFSKNKLDQISAASGLLIRPIGIGQTLLEARVVTNPESVGDNEIKKLLPIAEHLTKLDLRSTQITDRSLDYIGTFSKLTVLNLRGAKIGDQALAELVNLPILQTLNLTETEVSDHGLKRLSQIETLRQVFLWNSKVSVEGELELSKTIDSQ